jgi:hypothetical protein
MGTIDTIKLVMKIIGEVYPEDNAVEEKIEDWLKQKLGIDIDLSPNSPEKKDETK